MISGIEQNRLISTAVPIAIGLQSPMATAQVAVFFLSKPWGKMQIEQNYLQGYRNVK